MAGGGRQGVGVAGDGGGGENVDGMFVGLWTFRMAPCVVEGNPRTS